MDFPNWLPIVGQVIAALVVVVGLVGTLIPVLPGTLIIFAGALLWGWSTGFTDVDGQALLVIGIIAALSQILGQLAGWLGGKVIGSSRWGAVGAIVGSIVAVFVPVPFGLFGFVVYPFLLALLFELIGGRSFRKSLRSGVGSALGVLGGVVMQLVFGVVMVVVLVRAVV